MFDHILIASFGTGVASARASIDAVEQALARQAGLPHTCAFTSEAVRSILARRGESVPSAAQALEAAAHAGARRVFVQPTHMLYGGEYEKLRAEVSTARPCFEKLCLGAPLLAGSAEVRCLARVLAEAYPPRKGERLVLVGHGAAHFADIVYPAMQTVFRMEGRGDVYVGTLKGWTGFDEVLAQLRQSGAGAVHLVPLLLAAGGHAQHDMAGEDGQSWKARLQQAGFSVRCTMAGLGLLPGVQQMYAEHLREGLQEEGGGRQWTE